jgi:hypothetical protein
MIQIYIYIYICIFFFQVKNDTDWSALWFMMSICNLFSNMYY